MSEVADFFLQNIIRPRPVPPYFCHGCNHRFQASSDDTSSGDPVCPQCGSDFVEKVEQEEQRTAGGGGLGTSTSTVTVRSPNSITTTTTTTVNDEETPMVTDDDPEPEIIGASDPEPEIIRQEEGPRRRPNSSATAATRSTPSAIMGGPYVRIRGPRGQPLAQMIHEHIETLMNSHRARQHAERDDTDGSDDTVPPSRRHRQHTSPPREGEEERGEGGEHSQEGDGEEGGSSAADLHFSVGLPWYLMLHGRDHARRSQPQGRSHARGGGQPRPQQNPQVPRFGVPLIIGFNSGPVHSSPGDYAWGPSGLDDIITQMLANLEDSGPPPAKEEKIAEIPKIMATEEDIALCNDCSVCKEQFTVGEELLKLPCTHLYHRDCVIPWLKLHDTCPTCRYHLNTGKYEHSQETTD